MSFLHRWVVSAAQAKRLIEQKAATVLDVRNRVSWFFSHAPGAVGVSWWQFLQQKLPPSGKLIENPTRLEHKLRSLGICNTKPVIVVGNPPNNFGEEGHLVWMLRTLGHLQAAFGNGGVAIHSIFFRHERIFMKAVRRMLAKRGFAVVATPLVAGLLLSTTALAEMGLIETDRVEVAKASNKSSDLDAETWTQIFGVSEQVTDY